MEYSEKAKEALAMLGRTDFKNITKNELITVCSQLSNYISDVQKEILTHYPELTELINSSLKEYKQELESIISSDDASLKQFYSIAENEQSHLKEDTKQLGEFARSIRDDIGKCLEGDLTFEQRIELINKEIELFNIAAEKQNEVQQARADIVNKVSEKDSEKRKFNWGIVYAASAALAVGLAIGASALGVKIEVPKINK